MFCAVSLAIVWGAMAERTKLWVYFAFGVVFTLIYSVVSHWIWSPDGWLFSLGMQDFAGSTVVHFQGALAALAGALLLGARIGKFGADGKPNAIPGHNMAFTTLGVIILWFGWFGFNPGSTLGVDFGGVGFFAYVALNTNLAAAAGVLGAVLTSWLVIGKPDLSMMLNGAIAALVAITASCAFVAPWAAIVIGLVAGGIVVLGVLLVERARIDDPIGAISAHGMAGVWGTLALGFLALPSQAQSLATGQAGLFYGGGLHQLGVQVLGLAAVGAFTFTASFLVLLLMKVTFGIRTEPEAETAGLDVSEHGMWGYPEFYIPVPGGYGTESHGHLGLAHATRPAAVAHPAVAVPEPSRVASPSPPTPGRRGPPGGRALLCVDRVPQGADEIAERSGALLRREQGSRADDHAVRELGRGTCLLRRRDPEARVQGDAGTRAACTVCQSGQVVGELVSDAGRPRDGDEVEPAVRLPRCERDPRIRGRRRHELHATQLRQVSCRKVGDDQARRPGVAGVGVRSAPSRTSREATSRSSGRAPCRPRAPERRRGIRGRPACACHARAHARPRAGSPGRRRAGPRTGIRAPRCRRLPRRPPPRARASRAPTSGR